MSNAARPGVLVDLDGTLVDTNYLHTLAWSRALSDAGEWAPMYAIHRLIGMGPETYGHVVQGYRIRELQAMAAGMGLKPQAFGGYSRFFTEMAELFINFAYVKVLSRKKKHPQVMEGTIAPTSRKELEAVRKEYRMYSLIYPFMYLFSLMDKLIPGKGGYAVAVASRKGP